MPDGSTLAAERLPFNLAHRSVSGRASAVNAMSVDVEEHFQVQAMAGCGEFLQPTEPVEAGVLALAVELNGGRLGNVNPLIYSLSAIRTLLGGTKAPKDFQYFHRNISGNNNGYTVKPGQAYSEVLGNGTLDIKNFLGIPNATPAGAPSTPSNP